MRQLSHLVLGSVLLLALVSGLTPASHAAHASPALPTITLYRDLDGNGVFGTAGDRVLDTEILGASRAFDLNSAACGACGAVVTGWGWDDPDVDSMSGTLFGDGAAPSSGTATVWLDTDGNGVYGTAGDTALASADLDDFGAFAIENVSFSAAAVVIDGWGWDDPDVDAIEGSLDGWGWDDPDVDSAALPAGDVAVSSRAVDTDWDFGDDEVDWGFGDDEIDWGFGDDEIDWGFGDDEIDWGFGDDEIDWGFGDDEIDVIEHRSR